MRLFLLALSLFLAVPAGARADCKSDVDAAFDKLRATKAFRMRTKIVNADQGTLKMIVDFVLPDRMHQSMTLSTGADTLELIVIGPKAWSNNGQGWAEMPSTYAEQVAEQLKQSVAQPPPGSNEFNCLGDKELEGKLYAAYRTLLAMPPSAKAGETPTVNVQTVYVDKKTGLPERNIVTAGSEEDRVFDGTFTVPEKLAVEPPETGAMPTP